MHSIPDISAPISEDDISYDDMSEDKRGHKPRERLCVATHKVRDPDVMIRFVRGPDGQIVPDILNKLPGRGVWVSAQREAVQTAIARKAFARGFKSPVSAPQVEGLVEQVEALLVRRILGLLGMALKAGHISMGFDQVKAAAGGGKLRWRIEALDGSEDGRGKIRTLSKAVNLELELPVPVVVGCFTMAELGEALGRERVVHAGLGAGNMSRVFSKDVRRLAGFRPLIPTAWPDRRHETS